MKKLIYVLVFSVFSCIHVINASWVSKKIIFHLLTSIPVGTSHRTIETPLWLPNFLKITPHNIREGIKRAIEICVFYPSINRRRYSFFVPYQDRKSHAAQKGLDDCMPGFIYTTPKWYNSKPAAMIIEGFNDIIIDNSLDRGGNFAKERIKQYEQKHGKLHPALKYMLIRAGRTAGSLIWASIIGTLRTLKDPVEDKWLIPNTPSLGWSVRLEFANINLLLTLKLFYLSLKLSYGYDEKSTEPSISRWKDIKWKNIKFDFIIRA